MTRALVVVEPRQELDRLLDVASDFARGSGSQLLMFHAAGTFEGGDVRDRMQEITGRETKYKTGIEGAKQFARDVGETMLADGIDYTADGAFGDKAEQILSVADDQDVTHIFLIGRRRSPTGKAIFGDTAQDVLLNADVPVTLVMD